MPLAKNCEILGIKKKTYICYFMAFRDHLATTTFIDPRNGSRKSVFMVCELLNDGAEKEVSINSKLGKIIVKKLQHVARSWTKEEDSCCMPSTQTVAEKEVERFLNGE